MSLKLLIKPGERFFVGTSEVLVVTDHTTTVIVDGTAPVLREEDYIEPKSADTLAGELRLIVQQMYLAGSIGSLHNDYLSVFQRLWQAEPGLQAVLTEVSGLLMQGKIYRAVKAARALSEQARPRLVAV